MSEEEKKVIGRYVSDTITDKAYGFSISGRQFYLYPLTLGKMMRLQPITESLGVNMEHIQGNMQLEALRLAREKRKECVDIICCHTCRTRDELDDYALIKERSEFLDKNLLEDDIAAMMITLLSSDKTGVIMQFFGMDKEQEDMSTVMRIKSDGDKSNLTFGGRSVFGTLLDAACERYGWTDEYVTWGISYTKLRLMLADKVNTVYVTEDEAKRIPARIRNAQDRNQVNGDDRKAVREAIKSQSWD